MKGVGCSCKSQSMVVPGGRGTWGEIWDLGVVVDKRGGVGVGGYCKKIRYPRHKRALDIPLDAENIRTIKCET